MAQHDYNIANQTAANLRTDLNNALSAIVSNNSGAIEPADTFANMFWYDTSANLLKIRNEADSAWINLGYVDQGTNAFRILDDTLVTNTIGIQIGLLGDQSTATWQVGTGTTESLVSPAKVRAAANAAIPPALNASGSAPIYAARAWVNFNGTGIVTIRSSGNVSSITDYGNGDYGINFAIAMPNANYSVAGMTGQISTDKRLTSVGIHEDVAAAISTIACRVRVRQRLFDISSGNVDAVVNTFAFFC